MAATSTLALVSCQSGSSLPAPSPPASVGESAAATSGVLSSLSTPIPVPTSVQLSAPSPDVLWALVAGSVLFRSTDRGSHWEQQPVPARLLNGEIGFVDGREGWLSSAETPGSVCAARLWHTANAGTTWELLNISGVGAGQCKGGLSFVNASQGFISGSDLSRSPVVYHTADGGRTWKAAAPLSDPPGFATRAGSALLPGRVERFEAVLLMAAIDGSHTYIYRSMDGGTSWAYLAAAPNRPPLGGFASASRWLELSGPGEALETTDAGASWHSYATDYSQAAPIEPAIVFASEQVGFATVRGEIKRTQDGGAHWVSVATPGTAGASPSLQH